MAVIPSLRVNGVGIFPSGSDVYAGTGTAEAGVGGVLTVSTTSAQTTAVTTEEDLWTYSLPANTLSANGYSVRIRVSYTTASNANGKTIRTYFGASAVSTQTTSSGLAGHMDIWVVRTGSSAQLSTGWRIGGNSPQVETPSTPAADTTAAITIKVTGQNGTAAAGDVVFRAAIVEFLRPGS